MADVTSVRDAPDDRGQMLLVAAFGVAVMLVALVLILNTAIYTENLATRGSDISGGKDAARYRATTEGMLSTTVERVSYANNSSADDAGNYEALNNGVRWSVWNYSNISGHQQAVDSIVTNITIVRISEGTRVYRKTDGDFNDSSDNRNWTVATDARGVRNFTIEANDINQKPPGDIGDLIGADPVFRVRFDTGTQYKVRIYNSSSSDVTVEIDGGISASCTETFEGTRATVNFTNESLEGQHCPALAQLGRELDGETYDIEFRFASSGNQNSIEGNYTMVVNESFNNVPDTGSLNTPGSGSDPPYRTRAIYSMRVHLQYESKRLLLETDIRVAPGEIDA